jgi:endogenous inhibitor of DNA gyrase (YacG/DUF329 family)
MSQHRFKITCPKCGHSYSTSFSTGPRASCPKCGHDPVVWEILDRGMYGVVFYALWLLILVSALTFVFGIML